ncbi:MAG: 16S rRNA (cytosine(1402)-N(4))-methyltransferase RsmH [Candidatus Neomarinimicrobiota bacterium]
MSAADLQDSRSHIPVMLPETLDFLAVRPDGTYLDGTIGLGGHATAIHARLSPAGKLLGLDLDEEALVIARSKFSASSSPASLHHLSYAEFPAILQKTGSGAVNGILLDLGLSSLQLDSVARGFSFAAGGPLDMRFDGNAGRTAAELIFASAEKELADIIYQYGEERRSRAIARSIKNLQSMESAADLTEAIRRVTPPAHRNRTLARVYQALRIAVNGELDNLEKFLEIFTDYLAIGGRIVIISYHSLEDRLVKQTFRNLAKSGRLQVLTKRPLRPSAEEVDNNRRSAAAKLRAAERIG